MEGVGERLADYIKKFLTLIQTDYSKNFSKYAKMSYDATNKRVREVEELEFGSERDFYDVLYLYNEVLKMVITKIIFSKTTTFYRALPEVMAGYDIYDVLYFYKEVIKIMITKIINSFFSAAHFQRLWRLRYSTWSTYLSSLFVCLSLSVYLSLSLPPPSPCTHFHSFNDASYICI